MGERYEVASVAERFSNPKEASCEGVQLLRVERRPHFSNVGISALLKNRVVVHFSCVVFLDGI